MDPWQKEHVQSVLDNNFAVSIYKRTVNEIILNFVGPIEHTKGLALTDVYDVGPNAQRLEE